MSPFTQKVIHIIKSIPSGSVMTYGQIARLAGSPRAARQVVRILHSMSGKHDLPWHRVINAKGQIGLSDDESFNTQRLALELEGVEFTKENLISLEHYQFHPDVTEMSDESDIPEW
ncbi:MGMT family protein [Tumebacillus permanentifrigoris]|uniref:Methylated-DNA-protein-cysteine methyltransferase-like protein n=1 Tax=Tumebacillus permanentifrigoris TaxID=378543 RepID=A0A316DCQ8_9BACL|nr:MGMT family protein [Tumebacillus permanentifrigoris]PWK15957.1 methylated-DNA-protein-cysteine methyltransferase-like protein [Tumebacillus permanentifrigoris]